MASMAFQSFGVPAEAIELMLTIQNMKYFLKFFLRTGYGDYEDYAGGILDDSEVQEGWMKTTSHQSILQALEQQANCY